MSKCEVTHAEYNKLIAKYAAHIITKSEEYRVMHYEYWHNLRPELTPAQREHADIAFALVDGES